MIANVVEVALLVVRLPEDVSVVDAVAPMAREVPESAFAKSVVPVAFVNVSPPLNARSVVVALPTNGYANVAAEVR